MADKQAIIATAAVTAILAGGLYYLHHQDEGEQKDYVLNLDRLQHAQAYSLESLLKKPLVLGGLFQADTLSPEQPVIIHWLPEQSRDIRIDYDNCEITYREKPILKWDKERSCILATDELDPEQWYKSIPLSRTAIRAHPIHKSHKYLSMSDYAWLEKFYPKGSNPSLEPAPKAYRQPEPNEQDFKKKWQQVSNKRQESFEYRKWLYDHACASLRVILDARHFRLSEKLGVTNEQINLLQAAAACIESGEVMLPGPNLSELAKSKAAGWYQFMIPGLKASPLLKPSAQDSTVYVWADYEVEGTKISNWRDFLSSPEAQTLAMDSLMLANYQNLQPYFDKGYDVSGGLMAAHLVGVGEVKKLFNQYNPEELLKEELRENNELPKDGHHTPAVYYYQKFQGYFKERAIEKQKGNSPE